MFKFQHVMDMHRDETSVLAFSFFFLYSIGMQQAGTGTNLLCQSGALGHTVEINR